ncbi:LAQU0S03e09626g1_1 [Lachancea quebecensis]|uniref:LAQU0S03e09626g1_1 n=1 Tax=Lachancea quebecensis TaxID=1654605 RepID=A0A0P1KPE9_9SACH|nr:LAQU0S03e09626g1_1 [Lachancea quebecensis]
MKKTKALYLRTLASPKESFLQIRNFNMDELKRRGHARPLGHLENYFAITQRQKLYASFSMYCELSKPCSSKQLTHALRSVCLDNPILVHQVLPKNWPKHLEYYASNEFLAHPTPQHEDMRLLDNVLLSDILMNEQKEYGTVVAEAIEEFSRNGGRYSKKIFDIIAGISIPYGDPQKPNWRLLCFPEGNGQLWRKFIYVTNHCSSDGRSAANLMRDLSEKLNHIPETLPDSDVVFNYLSDYEGLSKIPDPIENRIDYKPPVSYLLQLLSSSYVRDYLGYYSKGPLVTRIDDVCDDKPYYSHFLNFSPEQMRTIKQKLKSRLPHCTMTPFLQACWLTSMYNSGKIFSKSIKEWFFDVVVTMNTAQMLPDDPELRSMYKYGSNVGGTRYNYLISSFNVGEDKDAFWSLVDYYQNVFNSAMEKKHYLYPLGALMLDSLCEKSNLDRVITDDLLEKPRQGVVFSNVGYFQQEIESEGHYVKDLVFAQSLGSLRHSFVCNSCTTDIGGMNIVACAARGSVASEQDWAAVCKLFKERVLAL